jgi:hypothetical protein
VSSLVEYRRLLAGALGGRVCWNDIKPPCDLCVSVVNSPRETLTTETQRTQRVHRENRVMYFLDRLSRAKTIIGAIMVRKIQPCYWSLLVD